MHVSSAGAQQWLCWVLLLDTAVGTVTKGCGEWGSKVVLSRALPVEVLTPVTTVTTSLSPCASGCCRLYEGKEAVEFQCSLQKFFLCLNQLMQSPLEGPMLLSQVWGAGGLSAGAWWGGWCCSHSDTSCSRAR